MTEQPEQAKDEQKKQEPVKRDPYDDYKDLRWDRPETA